MYSIDNPFNGDENLTYHFSDGSLSSKFGSYEDNSTTDIQNKNNSEISIYPNPASDFIKVANVDAYIKLQIFNSSGNMMKVIDIYGRELNVNISELNNGLYFAKLSNTQSYEILSFIKK